MRLTFVSAPGGSAFMDELLGVVIAEVSELAVDAAFITGSLPDPADDEVFVVVPHEYFALTPEAQHPTAAQRRRTIGFCVEHPGTATFETAARWISQLAGAVAIDHQALAELERRGIAAAPFELGYARRWDVHNGEIERSRPIDITYMGTTDQRRDHLLALQAAELSRWEAKLLIPPHEQMVRPRPDFLMGAAKYRHLADSKILLNLHRGASRALEWVRVLEAVCNGCVVVSEHSANCAPLRPGEHMAFGRGRGIVSVAAALLRHPARLASMRADAYAFCREQMSMRDSAQRLIDLAEVVLEDRAPGPTPSRAGAPSRAVVPDPPPPPHRLPDLSRLSASLPADERHELAEQLCRWRPEADEIHVRVLASPARTPGPPSDGTVDVVIAARSDAPGVLRTATTLRYDSAVRRVLVASERARHPRIFGFACGAALNQAIAETQEALILIAEPGTELFPGSVAKLVRALVANPAAAAAYGMMVDPARGELYNALPAERERLARRAYLGPPVLLRRAALARLGGYAEDPLIAGYEHHELWLRLVGAGEQSVLVPAIIGVGPRPQPPGLAPPALVPERAAARLGESRATPMAARTAA